MASRLSVKVNALTRSSTRIILRQTPSSIFIRSASSGPYYNQSEKKGIKIGHLFSGLAILGITATTYGLYTFYSTFTTYPNTSSHPIRAHLRAGLRSAATAQYSRASNSFETAYNLALDLASQGGFGTREEGLIKTTGIAVKWGGMWEEAGERGKAIEIYDKAFREVVDILDLDIDIEGVKVTEKEVMRGVSVGMKLGDLWVEVGGQEGDKEAERYYVWCIEEMMRLSMTDSQKDKVREELEHGIVAEGGDPKGGDKGMDLPLWLGKVELVAGFERLAELYSRVGNIEYAQPLLQQAIATLLPPPPKDGTKLTVPPIPTRCHAATLMNNLSSTLVSAPSPSADAIDQASRWARQALSVSNQCKKEADKARNAKVVPLGDREEQECELVAVVGSYNLGKLSELAGDKVSAKNWFEKSLLHSKRLGIEEGVKRSHDALRRLT